MLGKASVEEMLATEDFLEDLMEQSWDHFRGNCLGSRARRLSSSMVMDSGGGLALCRQLLQSKQDARAGLG